jgi:hypothetical protein
VLILTLDFKGELPFVREFESTHANCEK